MTKTKKDLEIEIKQLHEKLEYLQSQKRCYRCNGTGEIWTYTAGEYISCPECGGKGFA